MSGFKTFRDGFIGPIIILFTISLLVTWAVAATFTITEPEIEKAEAEKARVARTEVLKEADDFTRLTAPAIEGLDDAYSANNGAGYVFRVSAKGYNGKVPFMVGVDAQGSITGIKMLTNNETMGLGSRVGEMGYLERFFGMKPENDPGSVDSISGATLTSNALKDSIRIAQDAYATVERG